MILLPAFLLGFMGSLHCLGMCGPIAFMLPIDRSNRVKGILQIVIYHVGRLMAYTAIGLLFGILGSGIALFGVQHKISVVIGILMILSVVLPFRGTLQPKVMKPVYKGISWIKNRLGRELGKRSMDSFLIIGVLNGFLPCGLLYMAVLGAIAMGHPLEGSLFMLVFGLGTVPLMTAAAYLGNFAKERVRQRIHKLIPILVVLVGLLFIFRGLGLGIPYLSPAPELHLGAVIMECHP